jgi:protein O-mannosyl-transferase
MGRKHRLAKLAGKTAEMPRLHSLWPVWGVLAACVWIAFLPALKNGFVDWDDRICILENYAFRGLGWDQVRFAFTTFTGGLYQPLGWLIQSFTFEVSGLDPRGYHLVSLVFHVVNVILLQVLCVQLLRRTMPETAMRLGRALGWLTGAVVALFAIHPLRVEPVAWASCQAYLPGVSFSLLATLAYLQAHPAIGDLRRRWMTGSTILVVLAVLSKGSAIVLPFVFLILDAYPLRRLGPDGRSWTSIRTILLEKGPILAFCIALTAVAFAAKAVGVDPEVTAQPVLVARVAQASFGACFYLAKTVWPFSVTAYYPRPELGDFQTLLFAGCFVAVLLALSAALWQRKRWPWLLATLAAYLVIASPYLGLTRVGITLAADRYSYAPMMAWVVLASAGICKLAQHRWTRPVWIGAGAGALVIACGLMTLCSAQCRVWENSERLWSQALEHYGWSAELHQHMGTALAENGKFERAHAEFSEALRIRPNDFDALYGLGVLYDRRGETEQSIAYLREAKTLRTKDAMVNLSLGGALVHQGRAQEAETLYREALRSQPNSPNLHFSLGIALLHERKVDPAIDELTTAVELQPWYTEAYNILGGAYVLAGRQRDAVVQYRKALRLDPDHSASRIDLGLTLARQGHSAEAIAQLKEAVRRDRNNPEAHHVLGAILVNLGRNQEAVAQFEEVIRLRPGHEQARAYLAMARR